MLDAVSKSVIPSIKIPFRIGFPLIFCWLSLAVPCAGAGLPEGNPGFPTQELITPDGETGGLTPDPAVKYTVLDFWSLWCEPCMEALPEMDGLARKMKDRPIRFILINCDNTRSRAKVKSFIRSKGVKAQVLLDPEQGLMRYYGIYLLPHVIVLDSKGKVVDRKSGYLPGDESVLEKRLNRFLQ